MISILGLAAGSLFILAALVDAFETILQPRRVTHRYRFARLYYFVVWRLWRRASFWITTSKRREAFLAIFGPLSLLGLIVAWVAGLILGFGLLHWSLGTPLQGQAGPSDGGTYFYLSGTTLFTLGYGDVTPVSRLGRALAVAESGLGLGFLAVIVSYLPVLSQAFSRREITISLLDARAGSPPNAVQVLLRLSRTGGLATAHALLSEWEQWAAELLESHLSFPVLSYYRSQHDNQSWLAALTCILDTSALLMVEVRGDTSYQAQLTFAMARHAAVDLTLVLKVTPQAPDAERLPTEEWNAMREALQHAGFDLHDPRDDRRLADLRAAYEPFVSGLASRLLLTLPALSLQEPTADNWQRSALKPRPPGIGDLPASGTDDHFS